MGKRRAAALGLVLALRLAFAGAAELQTHPNYDDVTTAEGWAWSQIKQGLPADFGDHCGVRLDARAQDDAWRRDDPCRTIQASFILDLLTKGPLHDTIPYKGVVIVNAKIVGDVDLASWTIDRPLRIRFSRFEGTTLLDDAHAETVLDFRGSLFVGQLHAVAFRSEDDVELTDVAILEKLNLGEAKIKGQLVMNGANFKDDLSAVGIEVGGSLMMKSARAKREVSLQGATVSGVVNMVGPTLAGV